MNSARTRPWHFGHPPAEGAQRGAGKRDLDISAQRARRLTQEDCERFDHILFMVEENRRLVEPLCGGAPFAGRSATLSRLRSGAFRAGGP